VIALALLCLSALPATDKVELRFAPAEGSKVRRTITLDHALVVQEIVALTASGSQASQNEIAFKAHQVLRTLDEYRKIGAGRPQLLQRRFDEVGWTGSFEFPGGKEDIKAQSPLAGTSVVYTWVPEEQAYGKYYDAKESPEEALLRLDEDLDLRALLPAGAVAPGESWSVPAAALQAVFAPAGRLDLRFDAKKTRQNLLRTLRCGLAGNYGEFFGGESKGEARLKLVSSTDAQAHPLASVELELEFENQVDQRELQQSQLTSNELLAGYKCNKAPVTWKFKGTGTLVWDLEKKRAASLKLQGQQTLVIETELAIGKQPPVGQRMTLSGGLAFDWRIDDPAATPAGPPAPPRQGQK
jgi:hypothetical protein